MSQPTPQQYQDPGPVSGYIEELALPYDATEPLAKVKRRKRQLVGRIISLGISLVIMAVIYYFQRENFVTTVWVLYGVGLGVLVLWLVLRLVGYRQARRDLATVGQGIALRIGRFGVEVGGFFVPWPEVAALKIVDGKLGRSPRFQLEHPAGVAALDLNQVSVLPATLDTTARAYSAGRHGVDLTALGA